MKTENCKYFRMNNKMAMCTACNSGVGSPYCEYNPDCYYRQLNKLRTENEIREQLEVYKKMIENSAIFTQEFTLASGAKTALEWVLKEEK